MIVWLEFYNLHLLHLYNRVFYRVWRTDQITLPFSHLKLTIILLSSIKRFPSANKAPTHAQSVDLCQTSRSVAKPSAEWGRIHRVCHSQAQKWHWPRHHLLVTNSIRSSRIKVYRSICPPSQCRTAAVLINFHTGGYSHVQFDAFEIG